MTTTTAIDRLDGRCIYLTLPNYGDFNPTLSSE